MLGCSATDAAGRPLDLTGIDVTCQVKGGKHPFPVVATLALEWIDRAQGTYELWAPGDSLTTLWPTGLLLADIQYSTTLGARTLRKSTETFQIYLIEDITQ